MKHLRQNKTPLILVTFICLLLIGSFVYIKQPLLPPDEKAFQTYIHHLKQLQQTSSSVTLEESVPVPWDRLYIFSPYTDKEALYKAVGYKWRDITVAERDDAFYYIFMKADQVVMTYNGSEFYIQADLNPLDFGKTNPVVIKNGENRVYEMSMYNHQLSLKEKRH